MPPPPALHGVLVLDKPEGPTSHDVVARVRRALGQREVGHTGTLDPMATGVLALVLGRATRLAQFLSSDRKRYEATVRLGVATDTWDRTGEVVGRAAGGWPVPAGAAVQEHLSAMEGEQDQAPPPYSAKKIGGVRAYALAREGRPVEPAPARVTLHAAELLSADGPLVVLRIDCSAGFYVRALAHQLGQRLGCGACLEALRRLASGPFALSAALRLEAVEDRPWEAASALVGVDALLPDLPSVLLSETGARRASHGNDIGPSECRGEWPPDLRGGGAVRLVAPDGSLVAVARPGPRPGTLHPAVVLG